MRQKLLVIGGGFAGLTIISQIKGYDTILVDQKDYFEYTPSIFYAMVDPNSYEKLNITYVSIIKEFKFKFVQGRVTDLSDNYAICGGERIDFDKCVVCTGSQYTHPIKSHAQNKLERLQEIIRSYQQISDAENILVRGGGLVGIEAAFEIKYVFNRKNVTLATRRTILPTMPPKARIAAIKRAQKIGLNIVENDPNYQGDFDLVLDCIGNKYDSIQIGNKKISLLDVDDFLRFSDNIYVAGDIATSTKFGEKTAAQSILQAEIVVNNLKKGNKYQVGRLPQNYCISLGGRHAILIMEGYCCDGIIAYFIKCVIQFAVIGDFKGYCLIHLLHTLMVYFQIAMMYFLNCLTSLCRCRPARQSQNQELTAQIMN
ncbi:hypothetical protein pb186bvf_009271 [Paramecium bursaria]